MHKRRSFLLVGSFGLILTLLISTTVINHFDESLSPEVQKVLAKTPTYSEVQKQAYFYLLALQAGEKEDLEKKGEELWTQREQPGFWEKLRAHQPWINQFSGCGEKPCGVKVLEENPKLGIQLEQYKDIIQNYIRLMEYGEGAALAESDQHAIFDVVQTLPFSMHRLFLLQLSQWLRKGGDERVFHLLQNSNSYMATFFHQGPFLQRMVALVNMKANAEFLRQERDRRPQLHLSRELIDSIVVPDPEDLLFGAIESELQYFAKMLRNMRTVRDLTLSSIRDGAPDGPWYTQSLSMIPLRPFFRPNETLNRYWDIASQSLATDCPPESEQDSCVPGTAWLELRWPWQWIVNPVGKSLVRMMSIQVVRSRANVMKRSEGLLLLKKDLENSL